MLAGNRYYDPSIGRFLSRDPAQAGDNWYAYCNNNPITGLDPLGLQTDESGGSSSSTGTALGVVGFFAAGWNYFSGLFGSGGSSSGSPSWSTAQSLGSATNNVLTSVASSGGSDTFGSGPVLGSSGQESVGVSGIAMASVGLYGSANILYDNPTGDFGLSANIGIGGGPAFGGGYGLSVGTQPFDKYGISTGVNYTYDVVGFSQGGAGYSLGASFPLADPDGNRLLHDHVLDPSFAGGAGRMGPTVGFGIYQGYSIGFSINISSMIRQTAAAAGAWFVNGMYNIYGSIAKGGL